MVSRGTQPKRLQDPGIRALFERDVRWQAWLDVEVALARAEADLGMIPARVADEIARIARLELLDIARIEEGLAISEHPLVPLIWEMDRVCDPAAAGYIHWGATTQNITQTGTLLVLRRVHAVILDLLASLLDTLADLAERTADMALPGRTHGQHAVPATFGFKVGAWIDELMRHVERLRGLEGRLFVAMLGGAAGTFASFGDQGRILQARYAERLGMTPMPVPHRNTLDHEAEYVATLGLLAATASKMGSEVFTLMKQEFGEVEEPVAPGNIGSSTMPQKRNPKLSQDVRAAAAQVRALVPLALEAMQGEHEADRTVTVMMGRALTDACVLTGDILVRLDLIFSDLSLFPERMRQNLDLTGGMILSEALMLELGRAIGRQRAHDAVHEATEESVRTGRPFDEVLRGLPAIADHVEPERVRALLDPEAYVGLCAEVARDMAGQGRATAANIRAAASA